MMWSIFCSLAFCTFHIVFADKFADDIADSSYALDQELTEVSSKPYNDIVAAAQAVKMEQIPYYEILIKCTSSDFDEKFKRSFATKRNKCEQCYHEAKNTKDIQNAENCCRKQIAELKKDTDIFNAQAKTCIAKCAQDTTKCRKEIENQENKGKQSKKTKMV